MGVYIFFYTFGNKKIKKHNINPNKQTKKPPLTWTETERGESPLQEDFIDAGVGAPRVPEPDTFVKMAADDAGAMQCDQVVTAAACKYCLTAWRGDNKGWELFCLRKKHHTFI